MTKVHQHTLQSTIKGGELSLRPGVTSKNVNKSRSVKSGSKQSTASAPEQRQTVGIFEKMMTYDYGQMLLREPEQLFEKIRVEWKLDYQIRYFTLYAFLFAALYGTLLGLYAGGFQILASAIKIPFLLFFTLLLCQPTLYVFNVQLGAKLTFRQILTMLLASTYLMSIMLAAFSPILLFCILNTSDRHVISLVAVITCGAAGLFALKFIWKGIEYLSIREQSAPNMKIIKIWSIVYVLIGTQLSWGLRPFIGQRGEFVVFRAIEGNFLTAVLKLFQNLLT